MVNEILKARLAVEREGNPQSGHNSKFCRNVSVVLEAVRDHYPLPARCEGTVIISLPRGYRIIYHSQTNPPWKQFCAESGEPLHEYIRGDCVVSLDGARRVAQDVASGWLKEVVNQIYHATQCDLDLLERFCSALDMELPRAKV